jgi:hypothetical protein
MMMRRIAPILLVASLAVVPPAEGQWLPDDIPGDSEEWLPDRTRERMIERYRGVLGRLFTEGSAGLSPFGGPAYQMNTGLGLTLESGDAVLLNVAVRAIPSEPESPLTESAWNQAALIVGGGYELRGTRVFGASPLGWRTALGLGIGVMSGTDLTATTFEVTPTYDLVVRQGWSVPVGLRLSVSTLGGQDRDTYVTRPFLGLQLGVRWHLARREKLDQG